MVTYGAVWNEEQSRLLGVTAEGFKNDRVPEVCLWLRKSTSRYGVTWS